MKTSPFRNPLVLALDVDDLGAALKMAKEVGDLVGGIKVGPRLCLKYGKALIEELARFAPVFMDNKHFDIPSTMEAAVQASFDAGASAVTVHALAGSEALTLMAQLEKKLNQERPFRIYAVTILTSWDETSLPQNFSVHPLQEHVRLLAKSVCDAGLTSLVCSVHELAILKSLKLACLTPGIRLSDQYQQDQKRVATPVQALTEGAHAFVIGRPLLQAVDPRSTTLSILESLPC